MGGGGVENGEKVGGGESDVEPTLPSRYENLIIGEGAVVKNGSVSCALSEWGYPAQNVAALSLGQRRIGHGRLLCADGGGKRLEIQMAIDRHDADDAFGSYIGHQRFENLPGVESEPHRGLQTISGVHMVAGMLIFIDVEGDSGAFELHRRRCRSFAGVM